jgi:hypothetical protein
VGDPEGVECPGGNGNDEVAGNGGDGGDGRVERLAL